MEEINVQDYLVFKKDGEDGPRILIGGRPEALIINATKVQKKSEGKPCEINSCIQFINFMTFCELSIWRSFSSHV